jgi:hypothetical protein
MQIVYSVLAGLVWGGAVGFVNLLVTKKVISSSPEKISAVSLLRTLIDVAALAAVYFTRRLLPLRFEATLIATAVTLSLVSILLSFRLAASMKDK